MRFDKTRNLTGCSNLLLAALGFACTIGWGAFASSQGLDAGAQDSDVGAGGKRPNILVIMADDVGLENFGCYGSDVYQTPHIDRLAATGIRFDHAHSQPICTPSRVQIMTGIYNNRNYIRFGLLDPEAITFGNLLRDAGYRTVVAGKWQLEGGLEAPARFGFDDHCLWQLVRRPSRYPNPGLEIDGRLKDFKNGEFGPDLVTDYLCEFFESHGDRDEPFLAYYPMILPHWPFVPTPDHPDWDPEMWRDAKGEPGGYRDQTYWDAFVRYTDKMVGKLVAKLEQTGQRENTLIIFTGDNGTFVNIVSEFRGRSYRGGKGMTTDNGTHVPFIASWPAVIRPGQVSDALVDFSDVMPTVLEAAEIRPPGDLDGVSLMPALRGEPERREKPAIYCWYQRNGVRGEASQHVRDKRYKLYLNGGFYDTVADPEESEDLGDEDLTEEQRAALMRLRPLLATHAAVTERADPIQRKKRQKFE